MPQSVAEEATLYPLPEDTIFVVALQTVDEIEVKFTHKHGSKAGQPGSFWKWVWTFKITEGEYQGQTIEGNTEPKITNLTQKPNNLELPKPWVEQIIGREVPMGEKVDTDSLLGMPCRVTVRHLEPRAKKDGNGFWFNVEVDQVLGPQRDGSGAIVYDEPPF